MGPVLMPLSDSGVQRGKSGNSLGVGLGESARKAESRLGGTAWRCQSPCGQ